MVGSITDRNRNWLGRRHTPSGFGRILRGARCRTFIRARSNCASSAIDRTLDSNKVSKPFSRRKTWAILIMVLNAQSPSRSRFRMVPTDTPARAARSGWDSPCARRAIFKRRASCRPISSAEGNIKLNFLSFNWPETTLASIFCSFRNCSA